MATIFDCDGTLVDSETIMSDVLSPLAAEHGLDLSTEEALSLFRGVRMATCIAELERRLGQPLPQQFEQEFRRRMSQAFEARLKPIEGALELVQRAPGPICVASSGPVEKMRLTLRLTGLLEYFEDRLFSSYEIQVWKPAPDLFLHAARRLGVKAEECTVIEDSITGVRAGVAAGMRVYAYQPHGRHPDMPAGVVSVARLSELVPLLTDPTNC